MPTARSLRPFFCYYGGKWRGVPYYPAARHPRVVEPFAGAAGYSHHHWDREVLLIDSSPIIAGVWSYLVGASEREILALPDLGPEQTVNDLDVCQEARWLIGFWLYKGGFRPVDRPGSWMRSGLRPANFWGASVRKRIASQLGYIRHWRVWQGDYREAPEVEATWFIDPPYQETGADYGSRHLDYAELGRWCRSRPGQVIVCEREGAGWLPFAPLRPTPSRSLRYPPPPSVRAWWRERRARPPRALTRRCR